MKHSRWIKTVFLLILPVLTSNLFPVPFKALPDRTNLLLVNVTEDTEDGSCDSRHCSLREAMQVANASAGADQIVFDPGVFPLHGTGTIELTTALPSIQDHDTTIDASETGVTIDGSRLDGQDVNGFVILSSANTLQGLRLRHIPGVGVIIGAFEPNREVHDNVVNEVAVLDSGYGSPALNRQADGIWIVAACQSCQAYRNTIHRCLIENGADDGIEVWSQAGGLTFENLIYANTVRNMVEVGIEIDVHGPGGSTSSNRIVHNRVEGTQKQSGITINSYGGGAVDQNHVENNLILGNTTYGVALLSWDPDSSASGNRLIQNTIQHGGYYGLWLRFTDGAVGNGNIIQGNTILETSEEGWLLGLRIDGRDSLVYHNNLIGNARLAQDYGELTRWDFGGEGNFWSDYTGQDEDGDGIGETAYPVPPNGIDHFPLMSVFLYHWIYLPVLGIAPDV